MICFCYSFLAAEFKVLAVLMQPAPDDDVPALPADHRGVRVHPPRLQVGQVQDPHVSGQQVSIHTNILTVGLVKQKYKVTLVVKYFGWVDHGRHV